MAGYVLRMGWKQRYNPHPNSDNFPLRMILQLEKVFLLMFHFDPSNLLLHVDFNLPDSYALIGYKSGNGCESTPDWVVDAFERNPGSSNAVNWTEPVYAQADIPDNCGSAGIKLIIRKMQVLCVC